MKLVCLDKDECGISVKISAVEDHNNTCPVCFGVAAVYTDNYKPLIHDTLNEKTDETLNSIIAHVHNLINLQLGRESGLNEDDNEEN